MTRPSNEVLLEKILNLAEKIDEGFKGVHDRQDITNGKVLKNTAYREKMEILETEKSIFRNNTKWVLGFIGMGTLVGVLRFVLGVL